MTTVLNSQQLGSALEQITTQTTKSYWGGEWGPLILMQLKITNTVTPQWLQHLWDQGNLFERAVD